MVSASIVHAPHDEPAHEPTQSAQSGSCSAPMTRSPPSVGFSAAVVVAVVSFLLLSLPQAADTSAKAKSAPARPLIRLTSRTVSRPPCPVDVKPPGGRSLVPQ